MLMLVSKIRVEGSPNHHLICVSFELEYRCGNNDFGQLGLGDSDDEAQCEFRPLKFSHQIKQIVCGQEHTIILTVEGSLFGCGWNGHGQLGLGHTRNQHSFQSIGPFPNGQTVDVVSCGSAHTLIITSNGQVLMCGRNDRGQLGLGHKIDQPNFVEMPPLPDGLSVMMVACGNKHTFVVADDGQIFACGWGEHGQLGLGSVVDYSSFQPLLALPDYATPTQIECGEKHTALLTEEGALFACGNNAEGQLGLGHFEGKYPTCTLQRVPSLPGDKAIEQIGCGGLHTVALAEDGEVFACGWNDQGQLGLGSTERHSSFQALPPLPGGRVGTKVLCGYRHSIVLAEDGTVWGCGSNNEGQLGRGDKVGKRSLEPICFFGEHPGLVPWCGSTAYHSFASTTFLGSASDEGPLLARLRAYQAPWVMLLPVRPTCTLITSRFASKCCLILPQVKGPSRVFFGDRFRTG